MGSKRFEYRGRTVSLAELAAERHIPLKTLEDRVYRQGLPLEQAVKKRYKQFTWRGQRYSLLGLSRLSKINVETLRDRVYRQKLSVEDALLTPVRK